MTDAAADLTDTARQSNKLPLILGLVAALLGGATGFYASYSGLIFKADSAGQTPSKQTEPGTLPDVAFVPVAPMVVSLSPAASNRHLRFRAQLEVPSKYASDVEKLMPRVVDVLNGYLRALEMHDIENAAALPRLRAQLLRRVQIVAGPSRVNDLLIMEFVLN